MESKTTRKRKNHKEEFKREAVRLLEGRGDRTVADVAASIGVAENLLHAWKRKYGSASEQVRTPGTPSALSRITRATSNVVTSMLEQRASNRFSALRSLGSR